MKFTVKSGQNPSFYHLKPYKGYFWQYNCCRSIHLQFLWHGGQCSTFRTEILVFGNFQHFREIEEFPWKCVKWSHSPKLIILVPEYHKKPSNLEFLKLILPIISFQVNLWINGNVYCIYVNTARFYETLYLGPYW